MSERCTATHTIEIDAPAERCLGFFTPAGEEHWVDGWRPCYLVPDDGRTEPGMVFTTGDGDEHTIWSLVDFDRRSGYARYARVTPASRTGFVEVRCRPLGDTRTAVEVTYTMTALGEAGRRMLAPYRGEAFVAMIESWRREIQARLPRLLAGPPH